jgi:hypothetical protein
MANQEKKDSKPENVEPKSSQQSITLTNGYGDKCTIRYGNDGYLYFGNNSMATYVDGSTKPPHH